MTADATPTAPGAADPQRAQDGPQNVQSDEQGAKQDTGTEATGSSADRAGVPVTADSETDQAGLARGETLTDAASHPDPATAAGTGDTRTPDAASASGTESDADPEAEAAEEGDIASPGKVMRIGTMVKQLLEEVRSADLDEKGRQRLAEIHRRAIAELEDGLSAELVAELGRLDLPFDSTAEPPSTSELRIAQSQLVGWLEGLFHGIQTAIMAQQAMAKQETPPPGGLVPPGAQAGSAAEGTDDKRRTGNYL
ncbi:hypothetical protein GCM10009700_30540 [Brevibacterium sanguinis]|uniref:proteasome activator n=1 Tax=Brevibacterium sanguinis TaxID=232444 RepID=UPI0031E190F1